MLLIYCGEKAGEVTKSPKSCVGITLAGKVWYLVMCTAQLATAPPDMDVAVIPFSWSRELA